MTDNFYEVEKIVGSRANPESNQQEFKVKWKGYSWNSCTWEPLNHLSSVKDLILQYKQKKRKAEQKYSSKKRRNGRRKKEKNKVEKELQRSEDEDIEEQQEKSFNRSVEMDSRSIKINKRKRRFQRQQWEYASSFNDNNESMPPPPPAENTENLFTLKFHPDANKHIRKENNKINEENRQEVKKEINDEMKEPNQEAIQEFNHELYPKNSKNNSQVTYTIVNACRSIDKIFYYVTSSENKKGWLPRSQLIPNNIQTILDFYTQYLKIKAKNV